MDLLLPMRTFVRIVEIGSFTGVAAELNTTQPTISRQVAMLEEHLGTRLLTRTTRTVRPTDDGLAFYERAVRALEAVAEAESAVGRRRGKPAGLLRLATPVVFGRLHVMPRLPAFMARYRDVGVDLVMSDTFIDLVEQGIDVAVRVGEITDPGLIVRRIGLVRRLTVASPAYLAGRAPPRAPADLADHDCIVYTRLVTGSRWLFESADGPVAVEVSGRFRADNSEAIREATLAGLGIAVIPAFAFTREIEDGVLVRLLADFEPRSLPIHAVYPSRRFLPLKTRAIIDHLAGEFALDPRLSDHGM